MEAVRSITNKMTYEGWNRFAAIMALNLSLPLIGQAEEQNLPKRGEELSFGVTSATKDPDRVKKEEDHIVVMIGDDRIAVSIKNIRTKR